MQSYKDKILKSKIFALDDAGRPVGLLALTDKEKTLSKKKPLPYDRETLTGLIDDLGTILKDYSSPHLPLATAYKAFIQAHVEETRKRLAHVLSVGKLEPELTKMERKVKRILKQEFPLARFKKTLWKSKAKDEALTIGFVMHAFIERGIGRNDSDLKHYVAYLLKDVGLEQGPHKTIFNKVQQSFNRNKNRIEHTLALYRRLKRPAHAIPPELTGAVKRS